MPMSVANALATGVSSEARSCAALRSAVARAALGAIERERGGVADGARRLGQRAHGEQHALDVRVLDDRARARRRADGVALPALPRVGERLLGGALGDGDALQRHGEAGLVHHREHAGHAAVFLADQVADRAALVAEHHGAGRRGMDAELVLDRVRAHVVARARRAVRVEQEFRHQEQRNALRAGRRIRQPRQHEVDDVVGEVVLAVGDEDLLPDDAIAAVAGALGAGAQRADVGAGLRLGELHRPRPLAGDELGADSGA